MDTNLFLTIVAWGAFVWCAGTIVLKVVLGIMYHCTDIMSELVEEDRMRGIVRSYPISKWYVIGLFISVAALIAM